MRKIAIVMALVASAAFADPGLGMDGNEKLCPNYGTNRIGSMYTDGFGPFVTGEFLYWTSQMDGLDLAYTQQVVQGSVTHAKQKVVAPSFDWDPAFRVGLGYYCDCMDWSLFLEWTRLRSDVKTSHERETNYELVSLWSRPSVSNTLTLNQITSHWDFAYDTLDLSLCPGYFRYKYFAIKPEFGLRGAWIDWRYDVNSDYTEAGV
ncbi:MAG: hypothetical protein KDK71_06545, partial [Chlamydiia bacterium]|nr:hypothetical protein [Chlamydiia bacterium]